MDENNVPELNKIFQELKKKDIKSAKEIRFLDIYSTPNDLDMNAPDEELINISNRHNNKIALKYTEDLEKAKELMNQLDLKVFKYDSTLSEYELLHRQLTQTNAMYKRALTIDVDKGVGIYGEISPLILTTHNSFITYISKIIPVIEGYIAVIEQQISKQKIKYSTTGQENKSLTKKDLKLGFDLNYNDTKLELLFKELISRNFLAKNTQLENFKNAFNGKPLNENFKPLKWANTTKGSIFINFYLGEEKNYWTEWGFLFETARYKQLLSQSKNSNDTYKTTRSEIATIESTINNY